MIRITNVVALEKYSEIPNYTLSISWILNGRYLCRIYITFSINLGLVRTMGIQLFNLNKDIPMANGQWRCWCMCFFLPVLWYQSEEIHTRALVAILKVLCILIFIIIFHYLQVKVAVVKARLDLYFFVSMMWMVVP